VLKPRAKDRPLLLVFWGLTASGKSYLAKAWSVLHGFSYFNTDIVRKELAGIKPVCCTPAAVDQGIYSAGFSHQTYDALITNTESAFAVDGAFCVILDGSYLSRCEREKLIAAFAGKAEIRFILCQCSEDTVRARLALRAADPEAVSDGCWEVYLQQKARMDLPGELAQEQLLVLNTDAPIATLLAQLDDQLGFTDVDD